jgi:hypothetical protein
MSERLDAKQVLGWLCVLIWLALLSPGVQIERVVLATPPAAPSLSR